VRRRWAWAVVAATLVVAGCAGDDNPVVGGGPGDTQQLLLEPDAGTAPTLAPGVVEPGDVPAVPDGAGGADAGGGDPVAAPGDGAGPAPNPSAPALDASGPPGSFAPAVLRPDLSSQVVLELQVAPGAEPSAETVEHLRTTLAGATGKPVVVSGGGNAPTSTSWSRDSVLRAADAGAATAQGSGRAVLRLLLLQGTYDGDPGVLGVGLRGDVAAVFVDRAGAAAGVFGDPDDIVMAVATHEIGHLLGLVDLVLQTGRADPERPGHSSNPDSVMYWAVETDLVTSLLGARPPRDFDADDLADLRAIAAGG